MKRFLCETANGCMILVVGAKIAYRSDRRGFRRNGRGKTRILVTREMPMQPELQMLSQSIESVWS